MVQPEPKLHSLNYLEPPMDFQISAMNFAIPTKYSQYMNLLYLLSLLRNGYFNNLMAYYHPIFPNYIIQMVYLLQQNHILLQFWNSVYSRVPISINSMICVSLWNKTACWNVLIYHQFVLNLNYRLIRTLIKLRLAK